MRRGFFKNARKALPDFNTLTHKNSFVRKSLRLDGQRPKDGGTERISKVDAPQIPLSILGLGDDDSTVATAKPTPAKPVVSVRTPRPSLDEAAPLPVPVASTPAVRLPAAPAFTEAGERLEAFCAKFGLSHPRTAAPTPALIELTGNDLTPQQVVAVARHGAKVTFPRELMVNIEKGFNVLIEAAKQGMPVYGVTTGVGENKDQAVFGEDGGKGKGKGKELSPDEKIAVLLERSKQFNLTSIRAHTSGTGDPMSRELVRAGMLIRLNTLLKGSGGVSPAVVETLQGFLNNDITPLMPDTGSVGEGDLLLMGHIGLTMVGEWWVVPRDQSGPESSAEEKMSAGLDPDSPACPRRIMHARQALAEAGMAPVELMAKDFLSIISTNSLTAGSAALGVHDAAQFLVRETAVFGLCLQGINGNIAPFLEATTDKARPYPYMTIMARAIREAVQDSSLWDNTSTLGKARAMQDPVSYRVMGYRLGEVLRSIADTAGALQIQINHSDDNPYVDLDHHPTGTLSGQEGKYVVEMHGDTTAAIIPSGNFESYPFTAPMAQLLSSLGDLGVNMGKTVSRFESPAITHLPRFLAASSGHGFGAVSKGFSGLADQIQATAIPAVPAGIAVAGGQVEDAGTAGAVNAKKLHQTIGMLYRMASYQLLYATQAVDLHRKDNDIRLSPVAEDLHRQYRERVPFMEEDTQTTGALGLSTLLLKNWPAASAASRSSWVAGASAAAGPSRS